ncbi:CocE/NonD family hydrolase [Kineococcus glutinatus]|uniref:CocE/NonD family hydrolase n=1 Tax=Kineococcus glutinatus TaxID=1070872 RepID=A0ABP9HHP0_9ACTN
MSTEPLGQAANCGPAPTTNPVQVLRDVPVPAGDGTALATDVWLPGGRPPRGGWPVLLQRTPYDKSSSFMSQHVIGMEVLRALEAGFAVVVQDTRGRYRSAGAFDPFRHEAGDGADTIAWIRRQPWSDGRVAMYGASYIGATQLLAASAAPEGLHALAPQLTSLGLREPWTYQGGALQLGFVLLWVLESLAPPDVERLPAADRADAAALLAELRVDPLAAMSRLPVLTPRLERLAPYLGDWLRHPPGDDWWASFDPAQRAARIAVPALHIAGTADIFCEGSLAAYQALRAGAAAEGQHLVLGPWSHGNTSDWQGERWLGYGAASAALDLTGVQLEFFRAVLEGRPPDMPRVRYFATGSDTWREAADWPVPGTRQAALHLRGGGGLTPGAPGGEEAADRYVSDPRDPVPTAGGATFLPGLLVARNSGQRAQDRVEARPDVLVYTGEPLDQDLEVTGRVVLELWAASTATDCDWAARLTDVAPDGTSTGIVDGLLRARYRRGGAPLPLQPGRPERFEVVLGSTSHVFRAGHRIRLQVASSNHPRFDRNPQRMVDPVTATAADFVVAGQTVFHDVRRPSRLLLPTIPAGGRRAVV